MVELHLTKAELFERRPIFTGDSFEIVRRADLTPRDVKGSGVIRYGRPHSGWRAYLKEGEVWNRYFIDVEIEDYEARPRPYHYVLRLEECDVHTVYVNPIHKTHVSVQEMSSGGVEYKISKEVRVGTDCSRVRIYHTMRQPGERAHLSITFEKMKWRYGSTNYRINVYTHPRSSWQPLVELFYKQEEWRSSESFEQPVLELQKWIKRTLK